MSRIAPRPVINEIVGTWSVQPGMTFEVAVDNDGCVWIVESCPVGVQYWTVDQAADLTAGCNTRPALDEAVALGRERQSLDRLPSLLVFDAELETAVSASFGDQRRFATAPRRHLARI